MYVFFFLLEYIYVVEHYCYGILNPTKDYGDRIFQYNINTFFLLVLNKQ